MATIPVTGNDVRALREMLETYSNIVADHMKEKAKFQQIREPAFQTFVYSCLSCVFGFQLVYNLLNGVHHLRHSERWLLALVLVLAFLIFALLPSAWRVFWKLAYWSSKGELLKERLGSLFDDFHTYYQMNPLLQNWALDERYLTEEEKRLLKKLKIEAFNFHSDLRRYADTSCGKPYSICILYLSCCLAGAMLVCYFFFDK